MKNKIAISVLLSTLFFILNSCGNKLNVPIEKNKLVSNVTIEIPAKNITLNKDQVFNLTELGLKSNSKSMDQWVMKITNIDYAMKTFKQNKFINYDITIKNSKNTKPFYGKIAFFDTNKNNEMSAVSRYREISIDNSYFESATRGRVAIMYEYFEVKGLANSAKVPTWIILMSDEPF